MPGWRHKSSVSGCADGRIFMRYGIEVLYKIFRTSSSFVKIPLNVSRTRVRVLSEISPYFRLFFVDFDVDWASVQNFENRFCFSWKVWSASRAVRSSGTLEVVLLMLPQLISTVGDSVSVAHSVALGQWWCLERPGFCYGRKWSYVYWSAYRLSVWLLKVNTPCCSLCAPSRAHHLHCWSTYVLFSAWPRDPPTSEACLCPCSR